VIAVSDVEVEQLLEQARAGELMYYVMLLLVVECDLKEADLHALDIGDYDREGKRILIDDLGDYVPAAGIADTLECYLDEHRARPRDEPPHQNAFFVSRVNKRLSKRQMRTTFQTWREELHLPPEVRLERVRHSQLQRPAFWRAGPRRPSAPLGGVDTIRRERERRLDLFESFISRSDLAEIVPMLKGERLAGIYVDRALTTELGGVGPGFAIAAELPAGADVTEVFAILRYPSGVSAGKGIDAMKAASQVRLPVAMLADRFPAVRSSWIENWDDEALHFLVGFGTDPAPLPEIGDTESEEFVLEADRDVTIIAEHLAYAREPRFKFDAIRWYGATCAVCGITAVQVLQAAHIRPVRARGSDDPRNALVLCATHHRAFDAGLFAVAPDLHLAAPTDGPSLADLHITNDSITHLVRQPHRLALTWHWERWTGAPG
jgi:putative restriction endonuclease